MSAPGGATPRVGADVVPLDVGDPIVADDVLGLQRAAYEVEANLIGHRGIPQLTETLAELVEAGLDWRGIRAGGRLVAAVATSRPEPGVLDVERLVVDPACFRQGLATSLLAALPVPVRTVVSTGRDNVPARTLYARLGFASVEDVEVVPGLWVTHLRRDHVVLRAATHADVVAVLGFWQEAAEDAHRPPDTADAVRLLVERDPQALVVAEEDGRIVGTVIAGWDGWRCHLYRLAVAPDARQRGIGTALVARAEERFRSLGGTRADAMVLRDNELAHRSWQAGGYAPQTEWERWVRPLA